MSKKAMISQPMAGKTGEEIVATRDLAVAKLRQMGYEVANTVFEFTDEMLDALEVQHASLYYLASSLQAMSRCDCVYFCEGWKNARGCKIEHEAAEAYGLEVIYGD